MVKKILMAICLIYAFIASCTTTSSLEKSVGNKGIVMEMKLQKDSVAMHDSIMMFCILMNPSDSIVLIDTLQRIMLLRLINNQSFGDVPYHFINIGKGDSLILPNSHKSIELKIPVEPDFFWCGWNDIEAIFFCTFYIDEEKKKIIVAKNKISVRSKPFRLYVKP